jgi:hypothetical protein
MKNHLRWEYYVETLGSTWKTSRDDELTAVLNELGNDGWEIFHTEQLPSSNKLRLIAKRPLSGPVRKEKSWP